MLMQEWSTEQVEERDSIAFWKDAVSDSFLHVRTERIQRDSFVGTIRSAKLGSLVVNRVDSESHLVQRDRYGTTRDDKDWFFVNLYESGRCFLSQSGREQSLEPGNLSIKDSTRPFNLWFPGDVSLHAFLVPRSELLAQVVNAADKVARPLTLVGPGALFLSFAKGLARMPWSLLEDERADRIGNMFIDMLALTLESNAETRERTRPTIRRLLFADVCAKIRTQLSDAAYDLARASSHVRMAPRTLQKLFAENGTTFSAYLLEQRLLLADRQIRAKAGSISEVAYAVGFSDLSYFSRAFRKHFGLSPTDRRNSG